MNKTFTLFDLPQIKSKHDFLMHPMELKDIIPFEVKRVYFITDSKTGITGEHCHYAEEEFFFLIQGTGTLVIDKGEGKVEVRMVGGVKGAYVPAYVWHGFKDLSSDAIVFALSSTNYNPDRSDYLEDYQTYLPLRDQHLE
ncbi:MAG: FdtA/QdtA family cupin domain-containing protein [Candidatus Levybacteria bacterium]|nr:FdtA/QdtA family cupin domain-containing protein [Candidatus Levybacteria bacterium]